MTEAALLPYDPLIRFHNCTASEQKPGNLKKQSRLSLELKSFSPGCFLGRLGVESNALMHRHRRRTPAGVLARYLSENEETALAGADDPSV